MSRNHPEQNLNVSQGHAARIASAMTNKLKPEAKFEGKLGDSYDDALASYEEICIDLELYYDQKYKFFHKLFKGEAKRYYRNQVTTAANHFDEAEALMRGEYKSITGQNRCRGQLQ